MPPKNTPSGHPERANKGESKDLGAIKTIAPRFVSTKLFAWLNVTLELQKG